MEKSKDCKGKHLSIDNFWGSTLNGLFRSKASHTSTGVELLPKSLLQNVVNVFLFLWTMRCPDKSSI